MSAMFMVFAVIFLTCSLILLTRQSLRRSFRQRKMDAVRAQVRQLNSR